MANFDFESIPGYRKGSPPQYLSYHDDVDFLDEIEAVWGQKWGAQGIGRLRQVAMSPPTGVEVLPGITIPVPPPGNPLPPPADQPLPPPPPEQVPVVAPPVDANVPAPPPPP